MKKMIVILLTLTFLGISATSLADDDESAPSGPQREVKTKSAGGNFTVGIGPAGNVFVIDTKPELGPGVGGHLFFDYRWSPQFSTQFSILVTTEDGKGISSGNDGIVFLGMPTFDLKFYILTNPSRWDPYGLIGMGFYAITEGSVNNGTKAFGIGADTGIGTDFYISERFSVGLSAILRSVALIDSVHGGDAGRAIFPVSLLGNIAYHF